jgi:UDPglucose--hexose-1-phosphate uridylyltransferase
LPQLRQDPVAGYWVAIAKERSQRPFDFQRAPVQPKAGSVCPFCPGNEAMTPPELLRYPGAGVGSWRLRVIPNKYPAIEAHEVIIESAEHHTSFGDLPESAAVDLLQAVRDRMTDLKRDKRHCYIQFFKNNGPGSGASLAHPHSQLIAWPVVPVQVRLELDGSARHFEQHRSCIFCDILRQDIRSGERLILANEEVAVVAPYAPRFGFETWILPRAHQSHFEDTGAETLRAVALALHSVLRRIEAVLNRGPYNLFLHTAPAQEGPMAYYHWHIEVLPRISGVGGFEFGTGCYINTVMPEESAAVLRAT